MENAYYFDTIMHPTKLDGVHCCFWWGASNFTGSAREAGKTLKTNRKTAEALPWDSMCFMV